MVFTPRTIVNGSLLRRFIDQKVSVIVNIQDIDSNGRTLKGTTTDDHLLRITLSEPINSLIQDWVEVIGTAVGADHIQCDEVILFEKKDEEEAFDATAHNMLVQCINNIKNVYQSG